MLNSLCLRSCPDWRRAARGPESSPIAARALAFDANCALTGPQRSHAEDSDCSCSSWCYSRWARSSEAAVGDAIAEAEAVGEAVVEARKRS